MKRLANIISVVLHPLLLPTLTCALVAFTLPAPVLQINPESRLTLLWTIFSFTFLLPLGLVYFLFVLGLGGDRPPGTSVFLQSMRLENRQERFYPFLLTTLLYASLSVMLISRQLFHVLAVVFAAITVCLGTVTLVSRFWKISAHSTGIAGTVGFLLGLYLRFEEEALFYPLLVSLVLTGLLMTARLYLNLHTPVQVLAGGLLGFSVCLTAVLVWV